MKNATGIKRSEAEDSKNMNLRGKSTSLKKEVVETGAEKEKWAKKVLNREQSFIAKQDPNRVILKCINLYKNKPTLKSQF